jgi:hypothetical protein
MTTSGYNLSRQWFDFAFENPEIISPNHAAIYFFAIEHCNRLGWREKFGFPTQMAMDAIGIKKHSTYIRYFNDLVNWGFFKLVQKSSNQYSANIICLTNALPKTGKALGKAIKNHAAKQMKSMGQSTGQSKRSINKPINNKPINLNKPINYISNENASDENTTSLRAMVEENEYNQDAATNHLYSNSAETVEMEPWPTFEDFWQAYDKKRGDKEKILGKWEKLKQADKEAIMEYIPRYIEANPDKQFRKDPATFLNNKSWNDEIISRNKTQSIQQPSIGQGSVSRIYQKLVASRGTG